MGLEQQTALARPPAEGLGPTAPNVICIICSFTRFCFTLAVAVPQAGLHWRHSLKTEN